MFRLVLIIAAILIVGQLLRIGLRQLLGPDSRAAPPPDRFERTTQCPNCGVHVPKAALEEDGTCPQCRQ